MNLADWHSRRPHPGLILNAALEEADCLRLSSALCSRLEEADWTYGNAGYYSLKDHSIGFSRLILNAALEEADCLWRCVQGLRKQIEHTEMQGVTHWRITPLAFQIERVANRGNPQVYCSVNAQDRGLWKERNKKICGLCKIIRWKLATRRRGKDSILYIKKRINR